MSEPGEIALCLALWREAAGSFNQVISSARGERDSCNSAPSVISVPPQPKIT
ncbi:hypothetical protein BMYO_2075 [Bifidobacterium myosotis]|uniref:Uncharacterized protein n=1 Tax=Bifidobacterium myosotis TaxID=1630166 RepID=A0A261FD77_9BIFI|nr:hypothetical protein BMYO_2075 [Bifidobacterium myosotis]